MRHKVHGKNARNTRRASAIVRLELHLGEHKKNHTIDNIAESLILEPLNNKDIDEDTKQSIKDFTSHDKVQREHLKYLKELSQ